MQIATLDYQDTFLNFEHLKASFPGRVVKVRMRGLLRVQFVMGLSGNGRRQCQGAAAL